MSSQPDETPENITPWAGPETSLQGRYDDDRLLIIEPTINHEVAVRVGNQSPIFVDALDLLRVASRVVLSLVYDPSPTEVEREDRDEVTR